LTRQELYYLRRAYINLHAAAKELLLAIKAIEQEFKAEDAVNTALEQSNKGADDGNRSI
jgi:hypothetical protein